MIRVASAQGWLDKDPARSGSGAAGAGRERRCCGAAAAGLQDLGELYTEALGRLQAVGIAAAEEPGNWAAQPMTRGDLAVLGTEAFCRQQEASDRQGEAAYSDTAHRSGSGSVAVARDLGLLDGYPGDKLFPDRPVTYGEVGAFLARLLGLGPEGGVWPDEYLQAAAENGLLLSDPPVADYSGDTALRGWAHGGSRLPGPGRCRRQHAVPAAGRRTAGPGRVPV